MSCLYLIPGRMGVDVNESICYYSVRILPNYYLSPILKNSIILS